MADPAPATEQQAAAAEAARGLTEEQQHARALAAVMGTVESSGVRVLAGDAPAAAGEKVVFFVRHGEGFHNAAASASNVHCTCQEQPGECVYLDPATADARLTPRGEGQAVALQAQGGDASRVELVVVSTLSRAIQTATAAFANVDPAPRFVANEDCREQIGVHTCDRRRPVTELEADFPHVDFSGVAATDELWTPDVREPKQELVVRANRFLRWLMALPEQRVAVVCHSAFLNAVFQAALETDDASQRRWFSTGSMAEVRLASSS